MFKGQGGQPIIDTDADPYIPEGWRVEEHQKAEKINASSERIHLHLSGQQKHIPLCITGIDLYWEVVGKAYNANVLDYLLLPENQHLISEEWKKKSIFFFGTTYVVPGGGSCVRCLDWSWSKKAWGWNYKYLADIFYDQQYAIMPGSLSHSLFDFMEPWREFMGL